MFRLWVQKIRNNTLSDNDQFYSNNFQKISERVKNKLKTKNEQEIMVWELFLPSKKTSI